MNTGLIFKIPVLVLILFVSGCVSPLKFGEAPSLTENTIVAVASNETKIDWKGTIGYSVCLALSSTCLGERLTPSNQTHKPSLDAKKYYDVDVLLDWKPKTALTEKLSFGISGIASCIQPCNVPENGVYSMTGSSPVTLNTKGVKGSFELFVRVPRSNLIPGGLGGTTAGPTWFVETEQDFVVKGTFVPASEPQPIPG